MSAAPLLVETTNASPFVAFVASMVMSPPAGMFAGAYPLGETVMTCASAIWVNVSAAIAHTTLR
jgi:hypothetical protein